MNRNERIHKIDEMISRQGIVPVETFLSTLGISLATFKRDLDYLRTSLHAPLVWDRGRGGYCYGSRRGKPAVKSMATAMPTLWAGSRDTHALMLAHEALSSVKSGELKAQVQGISARIIGLLSASGGGDAPAQIQKRIEVSGLPEIAQDDSRFAVVASALFKRRCIRVDLMQGRSRAPQRVELSPQTLTHDGSAWHLKAFDHGSGKVRSIALDHIESVEVLNRKARDSSVR